LKQPHIGLVFQVGIFRRSSQLALLLLVFVLVFQVILVGWSWLLVRSLPRLPSEYELGFPLGLWMEILDRRAGSSSFRRRRRIQLREGQPRRLSHQEGLLVVVIVQNVLGLIKLEVLRTLQLQP